MRRAGSRSMPTCGLPDMVEKAGEMRKKQEGFDQQMRFVTSLESRVAQCAEHQDRTGWAVESKRPSMTVPVKWTE